MKINTTETWLSLLEAQIEKKTKKDGKRKEEYSKDHLQLTSRIEKLEMENDLLLERVENYKNIELALANVYDIAVIFNDSLKAILESQKKIDFLEKRMERFEKELAAQALTINELSHSEFITEASFLENTELIKDNLYKKILHLENRVVMNERESMAEKGSNETKVVRRRLPPGPKSPE
ncbi:hypothetical protein FZC79_19940 [Rossellomorea vietnamensis]|uniref:Uncharacterized protein n=2 Tax=Rossellomorea TaxID=2837508 RepID=A0A5D4K773_9BACI|nr:MULTISPECIES: hypothetical protein [Rossellomorea]TYR73174.1 hypothetical protein FZC79_19940 [Rossellomorea vietnamensis]TYS79653.1 hypothetical protein FZC80_08370 [Rossellomorea aquimaris]